MIKPGNALERKNENENENDMTLGEIRKVISVESEANDSLEIRQLLTDSRELGSDPEHTLFFAIKTAKNDGAKYIPELEKKGVRAFVTKDALQALQNLAAYKRQQYHGPVIAITGSNGKTVVKEWLYQLLREDYKIVRSPKSYNSQIGVPLSVWGLQEDTDLAIFEAGISQRGEMEKLAKIIDPTLGVVTYIGAEHGENFTSMEEKRAEKMKLFANGCPVVEDPSHQNIRTCAAVMRALGYDEETISKRILEQTHETVLHVNLSALVDNVRYFRGLLKPTTKLTCMVKAFAYGAGSVEVSKALQDAGVADYLAVAVADEGVELRRAGITLPIIVMSPEQAAMDILLENNLQPNVYSFGALKMVQEAAEAKGLENYPIHIKIDTGMHRLGFYKEDMPELKQALASQKALRVASIFSHLAGSDEAQFDPFTREQIAYFDECVEALDAKGAILHICNSAGIERFADAQHDMCRLGIGMYGFSAAGAKLRTVCSLSTTLLSVKRVPAGDTIGYGRHTRLSEDRMIGVIPIGYADGFDRRFSNYGGTVIVRGKRCPVVGNVCMDQAMIDITGTDAQVGDSVEVFGERLPLEELAEKLGTITYEILTSVSRRVHRVYYYE